MKAVGITKAPNGDKPEFIDDLMWHLNSKAAELSSSHALLLVSLGDDIVPEQTALFISEGMLKVPVVGEGSACMKEYDKNKS